jgi:hypothetical protein
MEGVYSREVRRLPRGLRVVPFAATFCVAFLFSCGESRPNSALAPLNYGPRTCVSSESVSMAAGLSNGAGSAEAYSAEQKVMDKDRAAQIAAVFGLLGAPEFDADLNQFAFRDGDVQLFVGDGVIVYNTAQGTHEDVEETAQVDAVGVVRDILFRAGLYPTGDVSTESEREELSGATVRIGLKGVEFDDFTWQGIVAGVDGSGQLVNLSYHWQNLVPDGEYPVVSEADAFRRLQDCQVVGLVPPVTGFNMRVKEVKLKYMGIPNQDGSAYAYFLPVYEFRGEPLDRSRGATWETAEFVAALVPAAADEHLVRSAPSPAATAGH